MNRTIAALALATALATASGAAHATETAATTETPAAASEQTKTVKVPKPFDPSTWFQGSGHLKAGLITAVNIHNRCYEAGMATSRASS